MIAMQEHTWVPFKKDLKAHFHSSTYYTLLFFHKTCIWIIKATTVTQYNQRKQ